MLDDETSTGEALAMGAFGGFVVGAIGGAVLARHDEDGADTYWALGALAGGVVGALVGSLVALVVVKRQ
jgi:hypothetical protein